MAVDVARATAAVRELLLAVGEDPDREGLVDTPRRVARSYAEMFAGLDMTAEHVLSKTFEIDHDELIIVRDIELYSTCEHHLVPFHGVAHIGYVPSKDGRVTGWMARIAAIGQGEREEIEAAEAIAAAHASKPEAPPASTDPVLKPGERVTVTPEERTSAAVEGEIVYVSPTRIALRRTDERAGTVHVHFPRIGYVLRKVETSA